MSHKVNLVRVLTAATGNSTPITLGAAYSQLFLTPAEAGAMNGRTYTYNIVDGNDWEIGKGVYTSSGTTLARTTVLASRISGTLGTSRISLSGTAQVRFVDASEDMDGVRGTRAVTGTSDVIANSDQGYVVTYSNAAAVAVSLAQASASNLFIDGWATTVQNLGAGTVTITPATSTINGASTLVLAQNMGAFIWSDGTNYHAAFMPVTKPLLAGNNLSDGTAATMLTNLGGTTVGKALFTAADAAAARTAAGVPAFSVLALQNYLTGLTLSTAGSSASFGIAAGVATDSTNVDMMSLASAYTKTTSAWAVGSGNGALDTGTIAMSWYHVFLIKRPDTGVVDILISASATAPTLPANYTLFRRIGSMYLNGSLQWRKFSQRGDEFLWDVRSTDITGQATATTAASLTLDTPYLVVVNVLFVVRMDYISTSVSALFTSLDESDQAPSTVGQSITVTPTATLGTGQFNVRTNNLRQIRARSSNTGSQINISTYGWIDRRGRD